jgi:hypothetical protein
MRLSKSLFGIFINPAFHRFGKFRKIMADGFHVEGELNCVNRFAFQQKDNGEFNQVIFIDKVFWLAREDLHWLY